MFKRKVYAEILDWKKSDDGRTALLLEGARRIGKTTIVTEFAKKEYKSYVLIDFSMDDDPCKDLFNKPIGNLDMLFQRIQLNSGVKLHERNSLIIFDEIQLQPRARQMIKALVKDGRYDYIETGSLISIKKNVKKIRIPSEEHKVQMYPMDFEEWLWANGNDNTYGMLNGFLTGKEPLGRSSHESMMREYRSYLMVGGMPQAVDEFLRTNNFMDAEKRKREIIDLYLDDIQKAPESQIEKIRAIFQAIPSLLSSHSSCFSPGKVMPGSRSRSFTQAIKWLIDAKYVNPCYRCGDPSSAPWLTSDGSKVKLYLLDTGLLFTLAFGKNIAGLEEAYRSILDGKRPINGGMFFENSVAQQIVSSGKDLFFHTFEEDGKEYEIDFIIPAKKGITAIEVKSSTSSRHKSFDLFISKHRKMVQDAYVIHNKDLRVDGKITYIPIYMAGLISDTGTIKNDHAA